MHNLTGVTSETEISVLCESGRDRVCIAANPRAVLVMSNQLIMSSTSEIDLRFLNCEQSSKSRENCSKDGWFCPLNHSSKFGSDSVQQTGEDAKILANIPDAASQCTLACACDFDCLCSIAFGWLKNQDNRHEKAFLRSWNCLKLMRYTAFHELHLLLTSKKSSFFCYYIPLFKNH